MDELIAKLNQERPETPREETPQPESARLSRASTPEFQYVSPRGLVNDVRSGVKFSELKYTKPRSVYYPSISAAEIEQAAEEVTRLKSKKKPVPGFTDPFVQYNLTTMEQIYEDYEIDESIVPQPRLSDVLRLDVRRLITIYHDSTRIERLLDSGELPVDAILDSDEGNSALHLACESGVFPIVELLLNHGADPNLRTKVRGHTPAVLAAARGNVLCLAALKLKGADLLIGDGLENKSPLHWAVWFNQLEAVKYLVEECGGDLTQRDNVGIMQAGRTPETLAKELGVIDCERYLQTRHPH